MKVKDIKVGDLFRSRRSGVVYRIEALPTEHEPRTFTISHYEVWCAPQREWRGVLSITLLNRECYPVSLGEAK